MQYELEPNSPWHRSCDANPSLWLAGYSERSKGSIRAMYVVGGAAMATALQKFLKFLYVVCGCNHKMRRQLCRIKLPDFLFLKWFFSGNCKGWRHLGLRHQFHSHSKAYVLALANHFIKVPYNFTDYLEGKGHDTPCPRLSIDLPSGCSTNRPECGLYTALNPCSNRGYSIE